MSYLPARPATRDQLPATRDSPIPKGVEVAVAAADEDRAVPDGWGAFYAAAAVSQIPHLNRVAGIGQRVGPKASTNFAIDGDQQVLVNDER